MSEEDLTTASQLLQVGRVVETQFGVGVLVEQRPNDCWTVRLWRQPGKSVATAALAYLQSSAVREIESERSNVHLCVLNLSHAWYIWSLAHCVVLDFTRLTRRTRHGDQTARRKNRQR